MTPTRIAMPGALAVFPFLMRFLPATLARHLGMLFR
jgi:hypothetical protein